MLFGTDAEDQFDEILEGKELNRQLSVCLKIKALDPEEAKTKIEPIIFKAKSYM